MSKREKIILVVMAVVVLYGAWALLLPRGSKRSPANATSQASDSAFVAQMSETLKQLSASQSYEHVIEQATTPWVADPFGPEPASATTEPEALPETAAPRQAKVAYTGFIKVGDKTMAIINGMEYETGETIDPGGLVVEQISPTRIVLKAPEQNGKLTIPLEDNE